MDDGSEDGSTTEDFGSEESSSEGSNVDSDNREIGLCLRGKKCEYPPLEESSNA